MIKIILLVGLISNLEAVEDNYRCTCEVNTLVKCRDNATALDLCHQCGLTTCGPTAFVAYFHYYEDGPCMAINLTKCCPHVKYVVIDDSKLCDCYCNIPGITVIGASQITPFECSCPPANSTTPLPVCPTSSPTAHGIDQRSAFVGVGATIGVMFLLATIALVSILVIRKFRDGQFAFRRMDDNSAPIID